MTENTATPSDARPAMEAYVLLEQAPLDMGAVLSAIGEGMGDPLAGVPLMPRLELGVNGAELVIGAVDAPVDDPGLAADLTTSPMRQRLEPVVASHRAHVTLGITPASQTFYGPMLTWTNVLAYLIDNLGAKGVWIPAQMSVTTDVLFVGDMEQPTRNFARVHAMWLDQQQGASLAFTAGLRALGWRELLVRRHDQPAAIFQDLRAALAEVLDRHQLPALGSTMSLGGVPHRLVEGTHVIDGSPVFELVPAPAEEPRKRRWPFGRGA